MRTQQDDTIHRTPNPDCPACQAYRQHKPEEWEAFHPHAGKGTIRDTEPIKK